MAATSPTKTDVAVQDGSDAVYRCENCSGRLVNDYGYWTCLDCTSVPLHPAD